MEQAFDPTQLVYSPRNSSSDGRCDGHPRMVAIKVEGNHPPQRTISSRTKLGLADGSSTEMEVAAPRVTAGLDLQDHEAQPGPDPELLAGMARGRGQSIVEAVKIPYKPGALEKKKTDFEKRMTVERLQRQDVASVATELKC